MWKLVFSDLLGVGLLFVGNKKNTFVEKTRKQEADPDGKFSWSRNMYGVQLSPAACLYSTFFGKVRAALCATKIAGDFCLPGLFEVEHEFFDPRSGPADPLAPKLFVAPQDFGK